VNAVAPAQQREQKKSSVENAPHKFPFLRANLFRARKNTATRHDDGLARQFLTKGSRLNLGDALGSFCRNRPTRFTDAGSYPEKVEGSTLNVTLELGEHALRSAAMHSDPRSIGELAYRLWQGRGCPDGTAEQDWLEAERQLAGETRLPVETPSRERSARTRTLRSKPVARKPTGDFAG
jgi:hypothetical protein